jgi:pimeloyl-ACP methyl ester carboxylesterase
MTEFETLEVSGQTTRLLDVGAGETVVVLHGWGGRVESMSSVVACLERHFRVLALDLPGFGSAPAPAQAWGTSDYAEWLSSLIRSRSVSRAHFLGHSFGGKVSINIAARDPELADKLILVDASGLRPVPTTRARMKRAVARGSRIAGRFGPPGRALQKFAYGKVASPDYRDAGPLRPSFVKIVNEDVSDLLPRISASTLLIWGGQDDDVPLRYAREMERLIPDAGLVVLEPAGHFSYLDQPDRFCRVVRHFLGQPVTP